MLLTPRRVKSHLRHSTSKTKTNNKSLLSLKSPHEQCSTTSPPSLPYKMIHHQITGLQPFSSLRQRPVNDTLDRVVHIYKEENKKRVYSSMSDHHHKSAIEHSSSRLAKISTASLHSECQSILKMSKKAIKKAKSVSVIQP